jgi:hypothetical protein
MRSPAALPPAASFLLIAPFLARRTSKGLQAPRPSP